MMDENKNNSADELKEISELFPETQGDTDKDTINSAFGGSTVKPVTAEDTTSRKMSVARESERGMGMKKKELICDAE